MSFASRACLWVLTCAGLCGAALGGASAARAATTLAKGDAVILSIAEGTATFKWATLVDLDVGTEIRFTDYGIPGSTYSGPYPPATTAADGTLVFTTQSAITRGTIFTVAFNLTAPVAVTMTRDSDGADFSSQLVASGWTGTQGVNSRFTTGGDSIFIYQGPLSRTAAFIFAASWSQVAETTNGWLTSASANNGSNASSLPQGMTIGTDAVGWSTGTVGDYRAAYTSPLLSAATKQVWLSRIVGSGANPSSWTLVISTTSPTPSFGTTLAVIGTPSLSSPTKTGISASGATLGGNVTSDGDGTITERGVVYAPTATDADPFIGNSGVVKVTASGTTGVFTAPVTGLAGGTAYTYKAYATNVAGTAYTSADTFTTSAAVVDTTKPTVLSVTRQTPTGQGLAVGTGTAVFRVTYSEAVTGVVAANFQIENVGGGTVTGAVTSVNAVSTSVYDVTVSLTGGSGEFRLKVIN